MCSAVSPSCQSLFETLRTPADARSERRTQHTYMSSPPSIVVSVGEKLSRCFSGTRHKQQQYTTHMHDNTHIHVVFDRRVHAALEQRPHCLSPAPRDVQSCLPDLCIAVSDDLIHHQSVSLSLCVSTRDGLSCSLFVMWTHRYWLPIPSALRSTLRQPCDTHSHTHTVCLSLTQTR